MNEQHQNNEQQVFVALKISGGQNASKAAQNKRLVHMLTQQFMAAWKLAQGGAKMTPVGISSVLARKFISMGGVMTADERILCGLAMAELTAAGVAFGVSGAATMGIAWVFGAAGVLKAAYDADVACRQYYR